MYRIQNEYVAGQLSGTVIIRYDVASTTSFLLDPANTDYQQFKAQINADEAQLEGADGNLMTPEEAKAYVATLP